jgi:hypothetical protein
MNIHYSRARNVNRYWTTFICAGSACDARRRSLPVRRAKFTECDDLQGPSQHLALHALTSRSLAISSTRPRVPFFARITMLEGPRALDYRSGKEVSSGEGPDLSDCIKFIDY